jgi:chromosomal replication initiator protein
VITIANIQDAVAAEHGIDPAIMREPDGLGARHRSHVYPRQEAMRLAMLLTEHTSVRIGHFFGRRNHATVLAASNRVDVRMRTDPELHERLRRVTFGLVRHG